LESDGAGVGCAKRPAGYRTREAQRIVCYAAFSPDGWRAVAACYDTTARVWDLPSGDRLAEDWRLLAELVTGQRMDPTGAFTALEPRAMAKTLQTLRAKYPSDFAVSTNNAETLLKEEPKK
jgi:WD40 repeat protein